MSAKIVLFTIIKATLEYFIVALLQKQLNCPKNQHKANMAATPNAQPADADAIITTGYQTKAFN